MYCGSGKAGLMKVGDKGKPSKGTDDKNTGFPKPRPVPQATAHSPPPPALHPKKGCSSGWKLKPGTHKFPCTILSISSLAGGRGCEPLESDDKTMESCWPDNHVLPRWTRKGLIP